MNKLFAVFILGFILSTVATLYENSLIEDLYCRLLRESFKMTIYAMYITAAMLGSAAIIFWGLK